MKRILSLALVFCVLCSMLLACTPTQTPSGGQTTTTTTAGQGGGNQQPGEGGQTTTTTTAGQGGGNQKPSEGGQTTTTTTASQGGGNQKPSEGGQTTTTTTAGQGGGNQKPSEGGGQQPSGGMSEAQKVEILGYLRELLQNYFWNPMADIPAKMLPSGNLINASAIPSSYASATSVSAIPANGFGEQWRMVVDNLSQSQTFFTVLSVVEGLTTTSVAAFEAFLDKNPSDTAQHSFLSGIYSVTIRCDATHIYYVIDYALGEQSVQIALSMDLLTKNKNVRVQIGDANALTYTIEKDSYTFAIKYLGVRRAYFEIKKDDDGNITGHIYEYLGVGAAMLSSVADFYVNDDYVTVVGNKAGGMIGFKGHITELYKTKTGKLVAYEVRESLASVVYNTLWFDLHQVDGIESIRYQEKSDNSEGGFFVNGSKNIWEAKKVGILGGVKAASRRFDIEFRTQYFYSWDATNEAYVEHAVQVPMLFVQEEYYGDLVKDVKNQNGITLSVSVNSTDLNKLMSDYDTLVDVLVANVSKMTADKIVEIIGDKKTFS